MSEEEKQQQILVVTDDTAKFQYQLFSSTEAKPSPVWHVRPATAHHHLSSDFGRDLDFFLFDGNSSSCPMSDSSQTSSSAASGVRASRST